MKVASGGRARYLHLVEADPALTERINMNIGLADGKRNKPGHQQGLKDHEPVAAADCVDVDSLPQRMPGAWRAAYLPVMLFAAVSFSGFIGLPLEANLASHNGRHQLDLVYLRVLPSCQVRIPAGRVYLDAEYLVDLLRRDTVADQLADGIRWRDHRSVIE